MTVRFWNSVISFRNAYRTSNRHVIVFYFVYPRMRMSSVFGCFMQRMFWGHTLTERGIVATRTSWPGPCLSWWDAVSSLERIVQLRASWVGPCLNEMQRQVTLHFMSLKSTMSRLEQIEPLVTIVLRLVRLVRVESPLARLEQVVSIGHAWNKKQIMSLFEVNSATKVCFVRFAIKSCLQFSSK